jgi:hypothetical protein
MPNVINAALHAALHRSSLSGHAHDHARDGKRELKDKRVFGSLVSEGPFPVRADENKPMDWFFPRPLDLAGMSLVPSLSPVMTSHQGQSNLPSPLKCPVGSCLAPSKESQAKTWLHQKAYQDYLNGDLRSLNESEHCNDSDCFDTEAQVGITIDANTGTTGQGEAAGKIYSARYLRLRENWNMGIFAKTSEKNGDVDDRRDLIVEMIRDNGSILVGGQQRLCTASIQSGSVIPLPEGKINGFHDHKGKWLVKWILLSPAVYPRIPNHSKDGRPMTPHCGGWLPNWIRPSDGKVMLRHGRSSKRSYGNLHRRGFLDGGGEIDANLVAAIVPKPIIVTGWALANGVDRDSGGAKSGHLAVPAGAVYYFEAQSESEAQKLAAALNWHGTDREATSIKNRRSTLMGEKGFGLGVCGTWNFFGT